MAKAQEGVLLMASDNSALLDLSMLKAFVSEGFWISFFGAQLPAGVDPAIFEPIFLGQATTTLYFSPPGLIIQPS
jgi:hypothetical protein